MKSMVCIGRLASDFRRSQILTSLVKQWIGVSEMGTKQQKGPCLCLGLGEIWCVTWRLGFTYFVFCLTSISHFGWKVLGQGWLLLWLPTGSLKWGFAHPKGYRAPPQPHRKPGVTLPLALCSSRTGEYHTSKGILQTFLNYLAFMICSFLFQVIVI